VALPNIEELNKIFDDYLNSLHNQSSFKKIGFSFYNGTRAWLGFGPGNPYAQQDAESIKIQRIIDFKKDFETTKKLSYKLAIVSWRKQLDIFADEYKLVIEAEVIHLSKYGFAIRAASAEICNAMKEDLESEVKHYNEELKILNISIKRSKNSAKKPITTETEERKRILFELIKLGDKDAAHKASELNLLQKHERPNSTQFTSPESSNAHVSDDAEIYPDIPWAYQPNLKKLYNYRLDQHEFPPTIAAWESWKAEQIVKAKAISDAAQAKLIAAAAAEKAALEKAVIDLALAKKAAEEKVKSDAQAAQAKIIADAAAEKAALEKVNDDKPDNNVLTSPAASSHSAILQQLPHLIVTPTTVAEENLSEQKEEVAQQAVSEITAYSRKTRKGKKQNQYDEAEESNSRTMSGLP